MSWLVPKGTYGWPDTMDNLRVSKFDIVKHIGPGDMSVGVVDIGTAKKHVQVLDGEGLSSAPCGAARP